MLVIVYFVHWKFNRPERSKGVDSSSTRKICSSIDLSVSVTALRDAKTFDPLNRFVKPMAQIKALLTVLRWRNCGEHLMKGNRGIRKFDWWWIMIQKNSADFWQTITNAHSNRLCNKTAHLLTRFVVYFLSINPGLKNSHRKPVVWKWRSYRHCASIGPEMVKRVKCRRRIGRPLFRQPPCRDKNINLITISEIQ